MTQSALNKKILKRYKRKGVKIAHFVQNELFSKYVGNIFDRELTIKETRQEIVNLFNNIDKTVMFVSKKDKIKEKSGEIINKLQVFNPETYIISCTEGAMSNCEKVMKNVVSQISNYDCELYLSDHKGKRIYFLNRNPEDF